MLDVLITAMRDEAHGIRSYRLQARDGAALPRFAAGAHIDVHVPGGLVRQYSLCNDPASQDYYEISVLLDPASRGGSAAVHQHFQAGHQISIGEPRNLFALDENAGHSLLFAGGIGITPILAMAHRLAALGKSFELHYCARSPDRAAFAERVAGFGDFSHLHFDDGADSQKLDAAAVLGAPVAGHHVYVCGPNGFMAHVLEMAQARGWADAQLHREYFAPVAVADGERAFQLVAARSLVTIDVPADKSTLQALLDAGIDVPLSCEQGICGTCLTRVLEGVPDHRDEYLSDEERAANDQFLPCCSRALSDRLVVDL